MLVKCTYLGEDMEIDTATVMSENEKKQIIPHAALEELIYNHPKCIENGVQPHLVCVVAEIGHYAFLCSLTDRNGRRVEGIGESLPKTLTTDIARDYPVLMAQKRAFDDAAIKFLGIKNAYSDMQIEDPNDRSKEKTAPAITREAEPLAQQTQTAPVAQSNGMTAAPNNVPPVEPAKAVSARTAPKQTPAADKPASANYAAPAGTQNAQTARTAANSASTTARAESANKAPANGAGDEFDTTILTCGSLKKKGLSIRAAYAESPKSVGWVAYAMSPRAEAYRAQKEICQRFLHTVGLTEEQWREKYGS